MRNRNFALTLALGLAFGTLIFLSLLGNILVCVAIYTNKRLRKLENFYFASMAVADLLLSGLVMTFAAFNDISGHWVFGEYCRIWISMDMTCCTASILHMCAISFDRYYHIHDPMRYVEKMTCRKVAAAIGLVWGLSAAIGFLPLAFESDIHQGLSGQRLNVSGQITEYYSCTFNLAPFYAIISSMVSFFVPCGIMIAAYTKLYRYARRHVRCIKRQLRATADLVVATADGSTTCEPTTANGQLSARKKDASDQKARITLGVIMGVFLVCWLPFFVGNVVRSVCSCIPPWLFALLTWLGYANSVANPAIYSIFNRDFRNAFKKILLCQRNNQTTGYDVISSNKQPVGTTADLPLNNATSPHSLADKSVML